MTTVAIALTRLCRICIFPNSHPTSIKTSASWYITLELILRTIWSTQWNLRTCGASKKRCCPLQITEKVHFYHFLLQFPSLFFSKPHRSCMGAKSSFYMYQCCVANYDDSVTGDVVAFPQQDTYSNDAWCISDISSCQTEWHITISIYTNDIIPTYKYTPWKFSHPPTHSLCVLSMCTVLSRV